MRILGDAVQEHRGFQTEKSWASHQQRFVARYAIGVAQPSFRYCAKSATHPAKKAWLLGGRTAAFDCHDREFRAAFALS
jgi:hypothetical protein